LGGSAGAAGGAGGASTFVGGVAGLAGASSFFPQARAKPNTATIIKIQNFFKGSPPGKKIFTKTCQINVKLGQGLVNEISPKLAEDSPHRF